MPLGLSHGSRGQLGELGSHQHHVIFLRQLDVVVGHGEAVFDRGDARFGGIVGACVGPAMRRDLEAGLRRLGDNELDVVNGIDVRLIVHDNLDELGSVVDILADGLEHLVAGIGEEIFRLAEFAPARLQLKLPAVRSDDAPGVEHGGPGHDALFDGLAQCRVSVVAGVAHVAHRGESGRQHIAGIGHALDGALRVRMQHGVEEIAAGVGETVNGNAKMSVSVEQARYHGGAGQVNHPGAGGNGEVRADRLDLLAAHQNDLVGRGGTRFRVDQFAGLDGDCLGRCVNGRQHHREAQRREPQQSCEGGFADAADNERS